MNKLSESHVLAIIIGLLVLGNNLLWTFKEEGYIGVIDHEVKKIQTEKTIN